MTSLAAAAPTISARVARPPRSCSAGLAAFVRPRRTSSWCWAAASLIGHTSSPDVALSVLATAVVALAFDPVQSRLEALASRAVHGGRPSPYDVLSRFSRDGHRQLSAEELPTADGAGAGRRHRRGVGRRSGWSWATAPRSPRPGHPTPPGSPRRASPRPRSTTRPGRRSRQVRHGGELLGVLVVQEREHVPLTSVEERLFAGLAEPGRAGAARRPAARRARAAGWPSCPRAPRSCARSRRAAGRRPGRGAPAARARHPRRRPAAPRRARREPPARRDAGASVRRSAPTPSSPPRSRRPSTPSRPWCTCPGASTRGCSRTQGLGARAAGGGRQQPGAGRGHRGVPASGATPRRSRRRRTSAAWRRCRTPPSTRARRRIRVRAARRAPDRWCCVVEDDGVGFDAGRRARGQRAWRTCATGSSRSAARSTVGRPPGGWRTRIRGALLADGGRLTCAPGSPGCWPASPWSWSSPTSSSPRSTGPCSPRQRWRCTASRSSTARSSAAP